MNRITNDTEFSQFVHRNNRLQLYQKPEALEIEDLNKEFNPNADVEVVGDESLESGLKKVAIYGQIIVFPTVLLFIIMNETAISMVSKIFSIFVYGIFLSLTLVGPISEKINAPTSTKIINELGKIVKIYTKMI